MSDLALFEQEMAQAIKEVHDAGGGRPEYKAAMARVTGEHVERLRAIWLCGAKS